LVLGMETPDAGRVSFEGAVMPHPGSAAWRKLRARMQMVFQDPLGALDRRLPIATQIAEPLDIHAIGAASERAARVEALLRAVGLRPDQGARYPHELSGGQRQRAVLARALATDPAVLVCDEPISALDVSIQAQVMNLLLDLQEQFGTSMLFVSHDLRAVRQVSHRVAVMYLGRIVEQGPAAEVLHRPQHPYTQALLAAVPAVVATAGREVAPAALRPAGELPSPLNPPPGCHFHPRCPLAFDRCRAEVPKLREIAPGHRSACHLNDQG
jgi:peptide/nickel transport system ATP-binding protein